ncbi:transglutaminase domain-containing protein [Paenibacillus sp. y28]|uniref:transglutaminase domain-containing protein n=1 Tax=Paenibacillus sp. y28 TaxID=3129110 RepID=UPI0030160F56
MPNAVSILLGALLALSMLQGIRRGAGGSAKHLFVLVSETALLCGALYLSWLGAGWLSPLAAEWLSGPQLQMPAGELSDLQQVYYTALTGLRDFSMLRFTVLLVMGYILCKSVLSSLWYGLHQRWLSSRPPSVALAAGGGSGGAAAGPRGGYGFGRILFNGTAGGVLGGIHGGLRALLAAAVLYVYITLLPGAPFASYIQDSDLYRQAASQVFAPVAGPFLAEQLPVLAKALEEEYAGILRRKYEIVDASIPDDISAAARQITAGLDSDEQKARELYKWVGTRITYDWDKVKLYEEQRIWKEQTPEDTFATREGVCIDYSRLYAMMARAAGLDVKVVTGLGYDGRSSYGPHAWNEVYLSERGEWVPLDSTWVASGGDWFNPPNFAKTHIKEA